MSFAKNMGRHLSNKFGEKFIDSAKKSTTDTMKTASKTAVQKTTEATGHLIGNKIADKITNVSKTSTQELQNDGASNEIETPKKRYISPEERQQTIDELTLVPKKDAKICF